MLRFFRSGFATQFLVIALAGVLLWIRAFFDPPLMPVPEGPVPLYKLLWVLFAQVPSLAVLLSFFIAAGSAFYLNYLLTYHEIVPKNASLPAFIFIILISYYPSILTLHPVTISILFLLLILQRLFIVYRQPDPLDTTYSVGFLTALGSFFYFPFVFFILLIWISFILFRIGGWREWVSSLLGFLTPFIFAFVYYFWFDLLPERSLEYLQSFRLNFPLDFLKNTAFTIFTVIVLVLLVTGLLSGLSHMGERNLEIRRKISTLIWLLPVMLLAAHFSGNLIRYHLIITFITVSALLSTHFLRLKKSFWQEMVLMGIFAIILLNNLFLILH